MDTAPTTARDRIMVAAVELAGQDGIHRVTMSAVAARAKVSRPTLYGYFPDVAHVLKAWVEREVLRVRARLQDVLDTVTDTDPVEVLAAYIDLQLSYFAESPTRALITTAALGSPPEYVAHHIEAFQADVRRLLVTLHERSRLRDGVDVDLLAGLVVAGITAVAPHVVSTRLSAGEARRRLLDLLLLGALPDRG
ncbi:MAG: TetR/AcrR family transcriptional regulator [Phycicoccus sp.]